MNKLIIVFVLQFFFLYSFAEKLPQKVMLVMDLSSSMLAMDIQPDRLQRSKDLMSIFLNKYPDTFVGLTIFSGEWKTVFAPKLDHDEIQAYLMNMETGILQDGTAIGSALVCAASSLTESAVDKSILLITDGTDNCSVIPIDTAIEVLKYYNIKLNIIGIGSTGMVPYPIMTPNGKMIVNVQISLNGKSLLRMAQATGGKYFEIASNIIFLEVIKKFDDTTIWLGPSHHVKSILTEDAVKKIIKKNFLE